MFDEILHPQLFHPHLVTPDVHASMHVRVCVCAYVQVHVWVRSWLKREGTVLFWVDWLCPCRQTDGLTVDAAQPMRHQSPHAVGDRCALACTLDAHRNSVGHSGLARKGECWRSNTHTPAVAGSARLGVQPQSHELGTLVSVAAQTLEGHSWAVLVGTSFVEVFQGKPFKVEG